MPSFAETSHSKDNVSLTHYDNVKVSSTSPGTFMPPLRAFETVSAGQTPTNEGRASKIVSPPIEPVQQQSWSSESTQAPKPTPSPPKTAFMIFSCNRTNGSPNGKVCSTQTSLILWNKDVHCLNFSIFVLISSQNRIFPIY